MPAPAADSTIAPVSDYELGDGLAAGVDARMAGDMAHEAVRPPVDDLERVAQPGEPPVPGAQWDELHQRWERWDEDAQAWVVVGDAPGVDVAPPDENPLPPHLSRVAHAADELDDEPAVAAEHRRPEPDEGPAGAQWNEIVGHWERWDDATSAWVPVL